MKIISFIGIFIVASLLFVSAVTLTKDATDKVVITKAYRLLVTDSATTSPQELVFGYADIYSTLNPKEPSAHLGIFIYDGIMYRATGFGPLYEQINCREEVITKDGQSITQSRCDQGRLIGETGGGSQVHPDGNEENNVFQYTIETNGDVLTDFEFKFTQEERILQLAEVIKAVDESIEWKPN